MNLDIMIHELNLTKRGEAYSLLSPSDYVDFMGIALLPVSTFIFSLISWNRKTDFRSFNNYLFINVIVNNIMIALIRNINIQCVADKFIHPVTVIAVILIAEGFNIYFGLTADRQMEIYNHHIVRQYLKTNLWGWGMLFYICLVTYFIMPALVPALGSFIIFGKENCIMLPLVFTGILYIILLFSMLKTNIVSTIGKKKCRVLRMLSFLFMLCIVLFLPLAIMPKFWFDKCSLQIIKFLSLLNDLAVILYFLTTIHNLAIRQKYYRKNQSKRLLNTYFCQLDSCSKLI